ncbi:MAG: GAF domain-containing protein [Chloroflexia bacterium]|nr:GAF domain-containing protein [Chloroflexia bacterium]
MNKLRFGLGSLSLEIIILSTLLVAIIVSAITWASNHTITQALEKAFDNQGRLTAFFLDSAIQSYSDLFDRHRLQQILDSLTEQDDDIHHISIFAEQEGQWITVASSDPERIGDVATGHELEPLETDEARFEKHTFEGIPTREIIAPIHVAGAVRATAAIFINLNKQQDYMQAQHLQNWAIASGGTLLLVLSLFFALRYLVIRPIGEITRTARQLAEGHFDLPDPSQNYNEIGQLSRAFYEMGNSLRQREVRLTALSEIGQAVNSLKQVDEIFRLLVERARDLLPFERFSIALLNQEGTHWSLTYSHGMDDLPERSYRITQGLPGWSVRTGESALIPDLLEDERADAPIEKEIIIRGCRSAIVVPLRRAEKIVGTLNVVGQGTNAYRSDDLALLDLLARQVETALQNARLLERERLRAEQLRALGEVNRQITSILDVDPLLHRVGEIIRETFGYHRAQVGLIEGEQLVFRTREDSQGQELPTLRIKLGDRSITSWVAQHREPLLVNDVTQDPRHHPAPTPDIDRTLSELAVPIMLGDEVFGVLDVQNTQKDTFSAEDLELLQTLAGNLAVALQNARLLQQERHRSEQLHALAQVNREITSILDQETLLRRVARIIQGTFGYHRVNVGLIEGDFLHFQARVGTPGEELLQIRLKVGEEGITGWVAGHGQPQLVNDVTQDPRYFAPPQPEADRALSEMAVPIVLGKNILGVLDVQSTRKGAFHEEDIGLLQTLAGNLAVALENARLYAEAQQQLQEQSALLSISASVSSTLRLEEVVRRVAIAMVEAMNVSACAISTWDRQSDSVVLLAEYASSDEVEQEWGQEIGRVYPLQDYPATQEVLESGVPLLVNLSDPQADPSEKQLLEEGDLKSLLMLPLQARDQIIGLVELFDAHKERPYSEREVTFCQLLANNAGLAIENARLYEQARQERDAVELLYQVGRALSAAIDMEQVLPRVLAQAVEKTGAYQGSIVVLDLLGNPRHHILVREDLSPSMVRMMIMEILRRGLAGWVVQNRQPALLEDTSEDPRWIELPDTLKGIQSALAVPLMRGEVLVGVLTLVHREKSYFGNKHLELITSVANQAAIAIDNARLFEDAQRRVAQLNALLEINQSLSSDLSIQELLELVTFSAHGLLNASNTVLYLLDRDKKNLLPQVALGADSIVLRETPLAVGEGLAGLVVQKRHPHILNEAHLSSISKRLVAREAEPEALLAVPLLQRGQAVGALAVGRYGAGVQFGPTDEEVAELLASQAVVALNNARLYEQVRRRAEDLGSLNRIARTVGSTLDLQQVLSQIIEELKLSFHVEAGSIFLLDEEENNLYFATTLEGGLERFQDVRIPMGVGIAGYVAQSGEPTMVNDVSQDPRFYSKVSEDVGFVNRSILCVPLISRDRIIGVIQLLNKTDGDFLEDDLSRLQGIAATVSVAIENAGLYEQTEEERGRLNAILISTTDPIIVTDAQQRLLLVNPAAARDFDIDPLEQEGEPLPQALQHRALIQLFNQAVESNQPIVGEITLEEGAVTLHVNISPVRGVAQQALGHVAVMQDITTLKELDKMKSEFVATVSHDLKTPLTAIRGFADLIKMTGNMEEQQKQFLDRIREITQEMANLITDLLDIGKIEAGIEMDQLPCDLGELTQGVVRDLVPRAREKNIEVDLQVPPSVPSITGDPDRLKRVLTNLVGNAIKYTPEGGHVRVTLAQEDSYLVMAVKDDGIGIAPRDQKQLFQKFYRVRSDETAHIEGTGLGLAIARSIVEHHGGRIWVESELGQGSTFAFSLPLTSEPVETPPGSDSTPTS